jgi:hypothetical protein
MMDSNIDGLMVVEALSRSSSIDTGVPTHEVVAAVMAGTVVVVKNAFAPEELRRLRAAIVAADLPFREPGFHESESWRHRREVYAGTELDILYDSSFLTVERPDDAIGRAARSTAVRMAAYWRALTGDPHTFVAEPNRPALALLGHAIPNGGRMLRMAPAQTRADKDWPDPGPIRNRGRFSLRRK